MLPPSQPATRSSLASPAREIADDLALRACRGILAMTDPVSGLTLDRASNDSLSPRPERVASIGASGFYLSLLPEFVRRGLITDAGAQDRAATTLAFVEKHVEHHGGLLRHFIDIHTGDNARGGDGKLWHSEFSLLDSALFFNGCLVVAMAYPKLHDAATALVTRVDWNALWREPGPGKLAVLCYGYSGTTKAGLAATADVRSTENLMPCLLAAGSPNFAPGRACWYHMKTVRAAATAPPTSRPASDEITLAAAQRSALNPTHPLFTSHYGLIWAPLAGLHDAEGLDLWGNARTAAILNRQYCREVAAKRFATFAVVNGNWWGLSAGDSPKGYVAAGPMSEDIDGTVWPTAALPALPWTADLFTQDLPAWQASASWGKALGPFGLAPFSLDAGWIGSDVIAIDLGCLAGTWANSVASEPGSIHGFWSAHPIARRGLEALEFSRPP